MEIDVLRSKIDEIDSKIVQLFLERLCICEQIGEIKKKSNSQVFDSARESQILQTLTENLNDNQKEYVIKLYKTIFAQSKDVQKRVVDGV